MVVTEVDFNGVEQRCLALVFAVCVVESNGFGFARFDVCLDAVTAVQNGADNLFSLGCGEVSEVFGVIESRDDWFLTFELWFVCCLRVPDELDHISHSAHSYSSYELLHRFNHIPVREAENTGYTHHMSCSYE